MANWSGEMQHLAALSCDPSRLPEMAPMLEEESRFFWCSEMLVDMFTNRKYGIVWSFYDLRCFWDSFLFEDACVVLCKDNDGSPTTASFRTHLSLNSVNPPYSPMVEPNMHSIPNSWSLLADLHWCCFMLSKFLRRQPSKLTWSLPSLNTLFTAHDTWQCPLLCL